jgi:metal-dependent hydrolase (beta-lactamase superfamily II)
MLLPPVDRVSITTVVDNSVDILRPDEKVARRWSVARARKIADLRAEHGLAHHVEVTRGRETVRIAFDFGLTPESMTHNFRELDLDVVDVPAPVVLGEGVLLSGELHATEPYEAIPPSLRMEEDGALVPDTFIGEQTLIANVRGRGLVVVTSCSHRGIVGICRHAVRVTGVPKIHAVIGGFHLSGLSDERVTRVVDAFAAFGLDHVVPQHCTGIEAIAALAHRLPGQAVWSSVGTTFTFAAA